MIEVPDEVSSRRQVATSPNPKTNRWCLILLMPAGAILRSVRWRWILPILAVATTSILMIVAARQDQQFWATHPGFRDSPYESQGPAILFAQLLNGPIFYLTPRFGELRAFRLDFPEVGRVLSLVFFWNWIGWGIDRKLHGVHTPFIQSRRLRLALYAAMLALTCLFAVALHDWLDLYRELPSQLGPHLAAIKLRSSVLGLYAMFPWIAGFFLYFARKFIVTLKS